MVARTANGVQQATRDNTDRAERAVLGSLLRDNAATGDVACILKAEDFRADGHQRIFRAVLALYEAGKPADLEHVADRLKERGEVADAGGYAYLAELWSREPTGALAEHYAGLVREASLFRQLLRAGETIADSAARPADTAEKTLEAAERAIFGIAQGGIRGDALPVADMVGDAYDRLDTRCQHRGKHDGPVTGFADLDAYLAGLRPSELIVVGARPSVGKTAIAAAIARHVATVQGYPVLFVSLEQSRSELVDRLIVSESAVAGQRFRKGMLNPDERVRVSTAGKRFRESAALLIDDTPSQSVLRIASVARRLKVRAGVRLVIIDYLQLVDPDSRKEARHEQVSGISRRLKLLARELALPVLALAQLNRASEDRPGRRPRLADLRESGGIEADADTVILLHRPDDVEGVLEVEVAKQRNGPTGHLKLATDRETMRFFNYAGDCPPE